MPTCACGKELSKRFRALGACATCSGGRGRDGTNVKMRHETMAGYHERKRKLGKLAIPVYEPDPEPSQPSQEPPVNSQGYEPGELAAAQLAEDDEFDRILDGRLTALNKASTRPAPANCT